MCLPGLIILCSLLTGALSQRVRVDQEVVSYPGQTVTMRCQIPNPGRTQYTQVSWIFERTDAERTNIAVFHPNFGVNYPDRSPVAGRVRFITDPPTLENPSIQITDVKMTDEGRYICDYAIYPSGNEQGVSSLVMLAKPKNTASTVTVAASETPVVVARCKSSNGRPAATISWSTSLNGNVTTPIKTENPDNTVSIQSAYMLAPQPSDNGKDISCVVTHRTMTQPETFPMKLVVEYPPRVKIVGYENNWYRGQTSAYLTCQADGNPNPTTVTWKTLSGLMPETVQVQDTRLAVQKVDDVINTTFICEVKNSLGYGKDQVTIFVRDQADTTSETLVNMPAGLFRVIVIIVEIAVFAAPTVILLQIICAKRADLVGPIFIILPRAPQTYGPALGRGDATQPVIPAQVPFYYPTLNKDPADTTPETDVCKTARSLFRVIMIIVEIAAFAAPTVILLQIICARRAGRKDSHHPEEIKMSTFLE
ncbi:hypothetical protein QQF64_009853 [Cirrhinus molitorella]|uniref:Ig-like domain-containing protein n=1 Tax=Cirrhinus molitorella TaxID=172907 RepID=A0ABR3M4P4_9TELE